MEDTACFVCQARAAVLSVPVLVVVSRLSVSCAKTSWWAMIPSSSRSEFVMGPFGLAVQARFGRTSSEKGALQKIGGCRLDTRRSSYAAGTESNGFVAAATAVEVSMRLLSVNVGRSFSVRED